MDTDTTEIYTYCLTRSLQDALSNYGQALRIHTQGWLNINTGAAPSGRFVEQFAPDQHTPDFAGAGADLVQLGVAPRSEENTSELPSLMHIPYAAFCLKTK